MLENETITSEEVTESVAVDIEEPVKDATEEVVEAEAPEATEEAPEVADETAEPAEETETPEEVTVSFDTEAPIADIIEQGKPVLEKYELPSDVAAYISTLEAKANVATLPEFADYGDVNDVKSLLDRQNYLNSSRTTENGPRPNTDKFVETIDPQKAAWLYHDLGNRPSTKYEGRTQAQEVLIDSLAVEGDTTNSVLERFEQVVKYVKANELPETDVPDFIPQNVREAYNRLSRNVRDDISLLDPSIPEELQTIQAHLGQLQLIQKGLDSDRLEKQRAQYAQQAEQEAFVADAVNTQNAFFTAFRDEQAKKLTETVKFSTDPKMQALMANQQVALLTQAFDDGPTGQFARTALENAGINFDHGRAKSLIAEMDRAAIDLTTHKRAVDAQGNPLDPTALRKAQSDFSAAGKKWHAFANEIIEQSARFAATGKAHEIKEEIAKRKIPEKARAVAAGAAAPAKRTVTPNPHKYGTQAYYEHQADELIREANARRRTV